MLNQTGGFEGKLLPGENVVWSGTPRTGLLLTARDIFLIPFSFVWCAGVIGWTWGAGLSGIGLFDLVGVLFVAVGLSIAVGRFFLDAWLRGGTQYVLTDRRVLIVRRRPTSDLTALSLDRLPQIRLTQRKDGTGTIRFGSPASLFSFGGTGFSIWVPSLDPTPQFLGIADAARVFDLLQNATRPAR